jgi:ribonuclease P protein component
MNRDDASCQGPDHRDTATSEALPVLKVLKERRDFVRLARSGRKWATGGLVLQVLKTPAPLASDDVIRFGLTASRKVGNAVRRNRARRRLRALATDLLPRLAPGGYDFVLIARHTTPDRAFDALIADLKTALARLKVTRPAGAGQGNGQKGEDREKGR